MQIRIGPGAWLLPAQVQPKVPVAGHALANPGDDTLIWPGDEIPVGIHRIDIVAKDGIGHGATAVVGLELGQQCGRVAWIDSGALVLRLLPGDTGAKIERAERPGLGDQLDPARAQGERV